MRLFTKLMILWVCMTIACIACMVIMHEETHKTIAENHGCINGTITYLAIAPNFECFEYNDMYDIDMRKQEYVLHSLNEIVSYNVQCLFALIYCLGMMVIIFYTKLKDDY